MKGPGLKLDLDVRRLWKCPQTGETIRLSGDVVSKSIQVEGKEVFMKLMEEQRSLHRDPYHFDYFELAEEEQSSSERAAAAARSADENQTAEAPAPPEPQSPEVSSATVETPEPNALPQDNHQAEVETAEQTTEQVVEEKIEEKIEEKAEEEEDSFGGGLL